MLSAPIDLLGSRLVRVLKTFVSEIEIASKQIVDHQDWGKERSYQ